MGSSSERGKKGKEEGEGGEGRGRDLGAAWGASRGAMGQLLSLLVRAAAAGCFVLNELDMRKERRRKERRKRKGRKRKEKNMENFPILKIFGEKNKRQFIKLVKIIFAQERNNPHYN
jgi:hypothetical protein